MSIEICTSSANIRAENIIQSGEGGAFIMTEVKNMSNELPRDAYTELMYDELYDDAPVSPDNAEEMIAGVERKLPLDKSDIL